MFSIFKGQLVTRCALYYKCQADFCNSIPGPLDVETVMAESEGKKVEAGEQPSSGELQDRYDCA